MPPRLYGGTERVISYLTEELVRRGHEVTLFAAGDSVTRARLVAGWPRALRLDCSPANAWALQYFNVAAAYEHAETFDVIHNHMEWLAFPLARTVPTPTLTTLHGRLDLPEVALMLARYPELALVSISDVQRRPWPRAHWVGTVYHGLPRDLYEFVAEPDGYLAFVGRICPEKRPDLAIAVARAAGIRLKIAAKVDPVDRTYYETTIRPLLGHPLIEYLGEVTDAEKEEVIANALGLLVPVDWPEPFGLVVIEAFACGTPVVARPCGAMREIVPAGECGYLASSVEDMVAAVRRLERIERRRCREEFERRFTVERMADEYLAIYRQMVATPHQLAQPAA